MSPVIYIWYEGGWLSPPVVTTVRSSEAGLLILRSEHDGEESCQGREEEGREEAVVFGRLRGARSWAPHFFCQRHCPSIVVLEGPTRRDRRHPGRRARRQRHRAAAAGHSRDPIREGRGDSDGEEGSKGREEEGRSEGRREEGRQEAVSATRDRVRCEPGRACRGPHRIRFRHLLSGPGLSSPRRPRCARASPRLPARSDPRYPSR